MSAGTPTGAATGDPPAQQGVQRAGPRVTQTAYLTRSTPLIGLRVEAYWPAEEDWFAGTITHVRPSDYAGLYTLSYDDETVEEGHFLDGFRKWVPREFDEETEQQIIEPPKPIRWIDSSDKPCGAPAWAPGCSTPNAAAAKDLWSQLPRDELASSDSELVEASGDDSGDSASSPSSGSGGGDRRSHHAGRPAGTKRPFLDVADAGAAAGHAGQGRPHKAARGPTGTSQRRYQQALASDSEDETSGGMPGGPTAASQPSLESTKRQQQQVQAAGGQLRLQHKQQHPRPGRLQHPAAKRPPAINTAGSRPVTPPGGRLAPSPAGKQSTSASAANTAKAAAGGLLPPPLTLPGLRPAANSTNGNGVGGSKPSTPPGAAAGGGRGVPAAAEGAGAGSGKGGGSSSGPRLSNAAARFKATSSTLAANRSRTQVLDAPVTVFNDKVKQRGPRPGAGAGAASGTAGQQPASGSSAAAAGATAAAAKAAATAAMARLGTTSKSSIVPGSSKAQTAAPAAAAAAPTTGPGGPGSNSSTMQQLSRAAAIRVSSTAGDGQGSTLCSGAVGVVANGTATAVATDTAPSTAAISTAVAAAAAAASTAPAPARSTKIGASSALTQASKRLKAAAAEAAVAEVLSGLAGGKQAIMRISGGLVAQLGPLGGARALVEKVVEHMNRLPEGTLRVQLLYVVDAMLVRARKALSTTTEQAAGGDGPAPAAAAAAGTAGGRDKQAEDPGLAPKEAKELVSKCGVAMRMLVPKAAYDGDSLSKVKRLLTVWADKQRIDPCYLREANLKLEELESELTAKEEAAARQRQQAAQKQQQQQPRRHRAMGLYMPAPPQQVREEDILGEQPPWVVEKEPKSLEADADEDMSLQGLVEEAEEEEQRVLQLLQQEQDARHHQPRFINQFGPVAVGGPPAPHDYVTFGDPKHACQKLLCRAGVVLSFKALLLEPELPWEVTRQGGEPMALAGTWKQVLEPLDRQAAAEEQQKLQQTIAAAAAAAAMMAAGQGTAAAAAAAGGGVQDASAAARLAVAVPDPAQLAAAVAGVLQGQHSGSGAVAATSAGGASTAAEDLWEDDQPVSGGLDDEAWEAPAAPQRTVQEEEQYDQYAYGVQYGAAGQYGAGAAPAWGWGAWGAEGVQGTSPAFEAAPYQQPQQQHSQMAGGGHMGGMQAAWTAAAYSMQQQQRQHQYMAAAAQQQAAMAHHMYTQQVQQQQQQQQHLPPLPSDQPPPLPSEQPADDDEYNPPLPDGTPPQPPSTGERPPLPDEQPPDLPFDMDELDDAPPPPLPAGPPPDVHGEAGEAMVLDEQAPTPPPLPPDAGAAPPGALPARHGHLPPAHAHTPRGPSMPPLLQHLPRQQQVPGGAVLPPHLHGAMPGPTPPSARAFNPAGATPGFMGPRSAPGGMGYGQSPAAGMQPLQQRQLSMGTAGMLPVTPAAAAGGGGMASGMGQTGWPRGTPGAPGMAPAWANTNPQQQHQQQQMAAYQQQMHWQQQQQQQRYMQGMRGPAGAAYSLGAAAMLPGGMYPGAPGVGMVPGMAPGQLLPMPPPSEVEDAEPMDDQLLAQQMGLSVD